MKHYTRHSGTTLTELLISIGILPLIFIPIMLISVQGSMVYRRYTGGIGPDQSLELALHYMEGEVRRARTVTVDGTNTLMQLTLPSTDTSGLNALTLDSGTQLLGLSNDTQHQVRYFLGTKQPVSGQPTQWTAVPSSSGDTLFRAIVTDSTSMSQSFSNAPIIVSGIINPPKIPDPSNPGSEITTQLFSYVSASSPPLMKITLTKPVSETTRAATVTVDHTLWTEFCVRNSQ